MWAITYDETGGSDVLHLSERPVAEPGPGEVRVGVVVSGVNPTDWKSRRGPASLTEPHVPNQDGAGVVEAVGEGVDGLAPGDRVWLWDVAFQSAEGTAQESVVVSASHAVALPDAVSFDVGASLGIPALTAHRALTAGVSAPLRLAPGALEGHTVLVTGGAGAVGHAAIQLATWAGATVLTTVSSPEKAELASAAGAAHVIDYRDEDVSARVHQVAPDGVDLVVEVNPEANLVDDLDLIRMNGTIAVYASTGETEVPLPTRSAMVKNARLQFLMTYTTTDEQKAAALEAVAAAAGDGVLAVGEAAGLPIRRFPLEDTAAAHDAVESGFVGKVLIDVLGR